MIPGVPRISPPASTGGRACALSGTHRQRGFTLVELGVVIAVTAVLASLLLAAVTRTRHTADAALCKSNLRQLTLGLELYSGLYDAYPTAWSFDSTNTAGRSWFHLMEDFLGERWPDRNFRNGRVTQIHHGIWACASYQREGGIFLRGDQPQEFAAGSYGYNVAGATQEPGEFGRHGLGGVTEPAGTQTVLRPIRPDDVRNPGNLIALGDTVVDATSGSQDFDGALAGITDLSYALKLMPEMWEAQVPAPGPRRTGTEGLGRAWRAMNRRHAGGWNLGFLDGHVEHLKPGQFLRPVRQQQVRWNYDNRVH